MSLASKTVSVPIDIVYQENLDLLEMKAHFHNSYELIYVIDGTAEFTINDVVYNIGPNNMVFISHLEAHELKVKTFPYKRYFILINPDFLHSIIKEPVLTSIFKHRPPHFKHTINIHTTDQSAISSLLGSMYNEITYKAAFWNTQLETGLQTLMILLYRKYPGSFPSIQMNNISGLIFQIQRYIEEYYSQELNLKDISRMYYTDMYYLSHNFKKITGYTFKEYLILQRISRAKDFLYYTNDDITTVGMKSGFNNVNHFIRIFKKVSGITPLQYRKMQLKSFCGNKSR